MEPFKTNRTYIYSGEITSDYFTIEILVSDKCIWMLCGEEDFNCVPTLQGPIFALVYPWYHNTDYYL